MHRALLPVITLLFVFVSLIHADTPYPNIAPTEPKTPADELKSFKVPPGFEVQLVASEPDIRKPIQMCFDAKGRLWVTTSEEYPFAAIGRPGKDRLYVLEDFGSDGKAKKVSIFADDLNIPIGVVPLPDCKSVIVSSIEPAKNDKETPTCWIWKLTDTDGDGKYDKKEKLYGPFGCIDTHGMNNSYTMMPDGWIYACHGFKNESKPKGKDGHEVQMSSGNTFRFRPDGSRIEIWTRGQVNPFGIAVDPYFNLYTADCHSKPITQLIRGGTYQSFGKQHDGLGFAPHVTIHGHDSTALCGLVYYAADHFPKEYLDHMFLGNVTSNCINYDKIEFKGSTPIAIDKGMFLSSSDLWFRPTDIKLGPDGALYFADFYNKIIGHYEVDLKHKDRDKLRGRVWRIVWKGKDSKGEAPKIADLTKLHVRDLHLAQGNRNITVRLLATQQFNLRDEEFLKFLKEETEKNGSYTSRYDAKEEGDSHSMWQAFKRPSSPEEFMNYTELAAENLKFKERWSPLFLSHVLRMNGAIPEWGQSKLRDEMIACLDDSNAFVRRAAVEALIAHPASENLRALLETLKKTPNSDDHLRYTTRVALRAWLRTLDDWDKAAGKTTWTAEELKALADIAPAVPNPASAQFLIKHFDQLTGDQARLTLYVEHAARYATAEDQKQLLELIRGLEMKDTRTTILLFRGYQQGLQKRGGKLPADAYPLAESLVSKALTAGNAVSIQAGIDLASALNLAAAFDGLTKTSAEAKNGDAQRGSALQALASIDAVKSLPILTKFLNDSAGPIALREKSAQVLAGMNRPEALEELVKSLAAASARLQNVIAAGLASSQPGAEALLKAIETGKASARLLQDKVVQTKLNDSKLPKAAERIALLTKGLPSADQKMLALMKQRSAGFAKAKPDIALGKLVFTKHCAACHQIGNEGVKVGPQLDGIGGRGMDRLLEDILDPNRNVDAAFRVTYLTMKDGKTIPGLVLREEGQILVLADDKGKEVRIPKSEIEEKRLSLLSPMPANLVDTIPEKDFHDLIAYLLTQRAKEK